MKREEMRKGKRDGESGRTGMASSAFIIIAPNGIHLDLLNIIENCNVQAWIEFDQKIYY
jgi:hypothetical protein